MRKIISIIFLFVLSLTSLPLLTSCDSTEYDIVGTFACVKDLEKYEVTFMTFYEDNTVLLESTDTVNGVFTKFFNKGTWEQADTNIYDTSYATNNGNQFKVKKDMLTDIKDRKYVRIDITVEEYIETYRPTDLPYEEVDIITLQPLNPNT